MNKLTASFVATVAVSACGPSPEYAVNPPPPPDMVEPTPIPPAPTETAPPETPPAVETSEPKSDLPAPGPGEKVTVKKNGTCWVYPDVDCPPSPATCNPPPPRQVQCPPDK